MGLKKLIKIETFKLLNEQESIRRDNIYEELKSFLTEAVIKDHFHKRNYERLNSQYTTFINKPDNIRKQVFEDIEFLTKIEFPSQDNIGVEIFRSTERHYFKKYCPDKRKDEISVGKIIWIVIRGNEIETVFFSDTPPQNINFAIKIEELKKYINEIKEGNFNLTDKDIKRLQIPNFGIPKQKRIKNENQLIINVDGIKWVVDKNYDTIHKKNKPQENYDVYDYLETINNEKIVDEILNFLV